MKSVATIASPSDALRGFPAASSMAMKMAARLAHSDVDFREVQHIVENDAVLCAELLRTVNSAHFGRRQHVQTIRDAVVLLGTNQLRRVALSLTVTRLFGRARTCQFWSQLRFNLHSASVAVLSQILVSQVPVEHGDSAFVAGLLHDIGKFAIAVNLKPQHQQIWELHGVTSLPLLKCEREILGFDHAEVSGALLTLWDMPEYVCQAASNHHIIREGPSSSTVSLVNVIDLADRFVNSLGMRAEPASINAEAICELRLPGFELDHRAIAERFMEEFDEFREYMR